MNDSEVIKDNKFAQLLNRHSFFIFVTLSIIIASIIVVISMELYNLSGAAQLDLSRPGYKSVRSQTISDSSDLKMFSGNGPMNQSTINEFKSLYDKESKKVNQVDAFSGDPLSPDALGFNLTN